MKLEGKNVLLTGASRGIGPYIARAVARGHARLWLSATTGSARQLEAVARDCRELGSEAEVICADLTDRLQRKTLIQHARELGGPIDILINNAGIEASGPAAEQSFTDLSAQIEVNLVAPIHLARKVIPGMIVRKSGLIINLGSMAGVVAVPFIAAYSATKAGLIAWSEAVDAEIRGSGVRVCAVCPTYVLEQGMHARTGLKAPKIAGEVSPERVVQAVLSCIHHPKTTVLVTPGPVRPLLAMRALSPALGRWILRTFGVDDFHRRASETDDAISPPGRDA